MFWISGCCSSVLITMLVTRLAAFSALLLVSSAQTAGGGCCYKKTVSESADNLDGEFILVRDGEQEPLCHNGCVYKRQVHHPFLIR